MSSPQLWFRITQKRSTIGLPKKIRETAFALGLGHRGAVVYQKISPPSAGSIIALKELVDVQIVDKPLKRYDERILRRQPPGFTVAKTAPEN